MNNIFDVYSPMPYHERFDLELLKKKHLRGEEISFLKGELKLDRKEVLDLCYQQPSDLVLVGGSLTEGMGNVHSDLDMYVICDERPVVGKLQVRNHVEIAGENDVVLPTNSSETLFSTYDYYGSRGLHIDIKYYTYSEVEEIFSRVRREYESRASTGSVYYTEFRSSLKFEEHKFFHRLGYSLLISGPSNRLIDILKNYPHDEYCYICFNECLLDYFIFKDLQGFIESQNFKVAAETARKLLLEAVQSYVHFFGTSNRVRKWIYHYLARLGPIPDLNVRFEELLFRGSPTDEDKIRFVFDSLSMIDEVLSAISNAQEKRRGFPGAQAMRTVLRNGMDSRAGGEHPISKDVELIRSKYFSDDLPSLAEILLGKNWNG